MPWCPRCDEVFPDGIACPRCRSRLLPQDGGTAHALQPVEGLPQLKVPRRYRRAFERLGEPKAPSQRLLVVATASLVFALGFLLGRIGSSGVSQPVVQALPPAEGMASLGVEGRASYLLWAQGGERLATLASHDLYSGEVTPLARFSPPVRGLDERTQVVSLDGSVALVLASADGSFVAAAPRGGAPFGWITGAEAAWESRDVLLVRSHDGTVMRWSADARDRSAIEGTWSRLLQTPSGAALLSEDGVVRVASGAGDPIPLPRGARVLAVSGDGRRVLADDGRPFLWDGERKLPLRVDGYEAIAASFAPDGDGVAATLAGPDGSLALGVIDAAANVTLKPLGRASIGEECGAVPAWDAPGAWVYVATGDGSVHAVEVGGGRTENVRARLVGCGVGWLP